jgi:hypothetical protein
VSAKPVTTAPRGGADDAVHVTFLLIEYLIVASLLVLGGVVLVRTIVLFFSHWHAFPGSIVGAIDGILVVIIMLDIAHTVFGNLRSASFPIRPFLAVGVLAGVRDILSASAHLTLSEHLSPTDFHETLIALGVGVGVVIFLLLGLFLLHLAGDEVAAEPA